MVDRRSEVGIDLELQRGEQKEWQVKLAGEGEHRVQVELKVPLNIKPTRTALSLAIPEAASTSLELDLSARDSDIIIGANEYFGQKDLGDGKATRLTAHLSPRSKLVVSWTSNSDSGRQSSVADSAGRNRDRRRLRANASAVVVGDRVCSGHDSRPGDSDRR